MEHLVLNSFDKEGRYKEILPQIESIISSEDDLVANLANVAAILKEAFDFFWVGFYIVKSKEPPATISGTHLEKEDSNTLELVLGPFQGPLACTRIKYGRGVCGTAWKEARTLVVPDVEKFPGHIACSSLSRSEIVVPIFTFQDVVAVLDIDSTELSSFDEVDAKFLEKLTLILSGKF